MGPEGEKAKDQGQGNREGPIVGIGVGFEIQEPLGPEDRWLIGHAGYFDRSGFRQIVAIIIFPEVKVIDGQTSEDRDEDRPGQGEIG